MPSATEFSRIDRTDCIAACERCIEDCLVDPVGRAECIRRCRDCIDACAFAERLTARNSPLAADARRLCAVACEACATECAKSEDADCAACADACTACARECRDAAAAS